MDAGAFVAKWEGSAGRENASAQEHFIDLCRLVREPTPNEDDPAQTRYTFEKSTERTGGARGRADVWLRGRFAWEYKGRHADLRAAYKQLIDYHEALGNPPLLVVCDLERFEVHTRFTNRESWTYSFDLSDLRSNRVVEVTTSAGEPPPDAPNLRVKEVLKALWADPEKLTPQRTTEEITAEAARLFEDVWPNCGAGGTRTTSASPASFRAWCSACSPATSACCRAAPSPNC